MKFLRSGSVERSCVSASQMRLKACKKASVMRTKPFIDKFMWLVLAVISLSISNTWCAFQSNTDALSNGRVPFFSFRRTTELPSTISGNDLEQGMKLGSPKEWQGLRARIYSLGFGCRATSGRSGSSGFDIDADSRTRADHGMQGSAVDSVSEISEREELEDMMKKIDVDSKKLANYVMLAAPLIVLVHTGVVFYWVYVKYSWNVMEPIIYFECCFLCILGYFFSITTSRELTVKNIRDFLVLKIQNMLMYLRKFNFERYKQLTSMSIEVEERSFFSLLAKTWSVKR